MEEWRDVPGYEGKYQVSDQGRVKSLNYHRSGKEQMLSPGKTRGDYLQIVFWKDGNRKRLYAHRLVWEAFNGSIPEGYEVNHINEDKTDCRLANLNLMTRKENVNWGTGIKRRAKSQSKMVEQYTLDGTHICTWFSAMGIERELGYSCGKICLCCKGKRHTHKGYIWKYAE